MRQLTGSLLLAYVLIACKTTAPVVQQTPPPPVILSLGNKAFTTDDFFQSFTKNQLSSDSAQRTDVNQYFDLYTNLKLKVVAAEDEKNDTTEAFREEMNTYRKQLAQSYLVDNVLVESLAAEAYQRMQQEVNASHILVSVTDDAAPADTLKAYLTALSLRRQVQSAEDFARLAREHSQDATTAQTGGNLGYFTAFSVVYPLETAAYTTPIGTVSMPVRTRFGYHLVRVNDRRPSRGTIRVAHILGRISPGADESGQTATRQRIEAAYARLQKGESFETVCRDVSDDATSRSNGGLLPGFETGRQVPAFEEAAFALTKPGDFSTPIQTNYGWHIIKLIDRRPIKPFVDLAPALRQRVTTDTRADVLRQSTVQRLMKEYAVRENKSVVESALQKADSTLLMGRWRFTTPLDPGLDRKSILTIADQSYTINEFFDYVQQRQQPPRNPAMTATANQENTSPANLGSPAVAMRRLLDRFVGDRLIATEEQNLDKKSPEFRALLSEIRDGVLLSQMMERHVWERSMADSTGQQQFFDQHKANYNFPQRALATIITAPTDALLKTTTDMISGKPPYQLKRSGAKLTYTRNQTSLTAPQRDNLFETVAVLIRNPDYLIEVTGSHDPAESDSVSAGRIRSVVNYLRQSGVSLSRISEKDYQGARPGESKLSSKDPATQRTVTFQYFSNAKTDVANVINAQWQQTEGSTTPTNTSAVTITEGLFAKGMNPYLDAITTWQPGTTIQHPDGKAVSVTITRVDSPRPKTFAEARGSVINDYQAFLETQWMAQLRQKYPVKINEEEKRKLVK
ncbi:peptidylprolyl isomerase [Spirosoma utsteinense]|uniref:Peptidyl-prolyl cis-trans isomerase SurA n=1 Tax=Spirosoma utsteinense TaxID=2585773 RepID=A0ABR6W450_9BACT|nr:peptidylprolyl isomerase [Spirosoma utsteinense]MBC3785964.1 peptidyl-prolyl cis-trans isomerase SurA [Spirosoma utsteinense]MBC3790662.1 peptidyl-prolyl cis-trans isomerase SurA [Spirosoma utsteinense]